MNEIFNYSNCSKILDTYKNGYWISKDSNKIFFLDTFDEKYNVSALNYILKFNLITHTQRMAVIKKIGKDTISEDDRIKIGIILCLHDATDNVIDYLNIFKDTDYTKTTDIEIMFKSQYYLKSLYKLKDINIFHAAIYGNKPKTLEYLVYKYGFNFWDEFNELITQRYGTPFIKAFDIFKTSLIDKLPSFSLKLKKPENLSKCIIDQLLKFNLETIVEKIVKENKNDKLYLEYFSSCISHRKLRLVRNFRREELHTDLNIDDFKYYLSGILVKLFEYTDNHNRIKNAQNICGIFTIILKYIEEHFTINEITVLIGHNDSFLTSIAGFTKGYEIFRKIDKYIKDYNYNDNDGYKLAYDAARYGSLGTYKFLEKKSLIDYNDLNDIGDSVLNIVFYNINLDIIEYVFNKYKVSSEDIKNLDINRTIIIILKRRHFNTKWKLEVKKEKRIIYKKIEILSRLVNLTPYLSDIISKFDFIDKIDLNKILKLCKKCDYDDSIKLDTYLNPSYYFDRYIPMFVFVENEFDLYKRLVHLYAYYDIQILNCIFIQVIKYRCIHSKWVTFLDEYCSNLDYLSNYKLFIKCGEFSFSDCPHKTYYTCMMDTFNVIRSNVSEDEYFKLKVNQDKNHYIKNCAFKYINWFNDKLERWNNPEFVRVYFLNCIQLSNVFLTSCSYLEFKDIKGWILLHKLLRRKIRSVNNRKLMEHKSNLSGFFNVLEYSPNLDMEGINKNIGRKFKMEINKSMTDNEAIKNPIHIKPEHLLEKDFDQYDYYLSEKVDGITKKINPQNCKMVPKFPKKYVDELNTEYIADLNIHFVYGIDNYEIDDQEFINDLRDILKLDDIISNFGNLEKYADKERGFMERYMTYIKDNNFSRKTVFWYPKKIWKIYGREVFSTLKNIWDKKCELFPTDGWILWRSDKYSDYLESFDNPMYKIKSQDKLTLDLRYTKDNIMEDFEKNKYRVFIEDDIKIKESIFPGEIYRCYYDSEKDVWCPRDLRKDKKNPNSKEIATYLTDSHTKYSWNIDDILNIKDVDYYCKGGFENSKLSQDYLDIFEKIKGGKVLDIGCGYTPLKREFKEKYRNGNWNKISYTGIDSDFNVFNSHSGNNINILWMDLNLNGANRWGHLYNYFVNQREINSVFSEKYDHILIINSVHYFDMDKLFKTINEVSKPGTRVYLKYLCKEIFDDKLGDFKGYIDNDDNFVRNLGDGRISIYYHWTHNKPQTEKLISGRELEDNFEKIGFKKMESRGIPIKPNNYGNVWCGYLECFILEEFVCL